MTQEEVQAFCANNGISVSRPGQPLHVVDPTQLPASVRKFVNDDGSYAGEGTPESDDDKSGTNEASSTLKGKLPDDFPHVTELRAAGVTTYDKVRALGGDYTEVSGIGDVKGKEIDEALKR